MRRIRRPRLVAVLLAVGIAGASVALALFPHSPSAPPSEGRGSGPVLFEDVTGRSGLVFSHDAGPLPQDGRYFLPQIMGSGAAAFDFDGDGLLDIYLLTNGGPQSAATNRLFRQMPGGRFKDASEGSGLDFAGHNVGVAIGDVDNDGLPDVLVTQFGGLKLFLNQGNGKFKDISRESGLDSPLWGASAAFFDFDRDGLLDLVVVNYLEFDPTRICDRDGRAFDYCPPHVFNKQVAKLFRNRGVPSTGGAVRFEDVTLASGIGARAGTGLGVVAMDFTGDGWPDIFVANDAQANYLWVNRRDGTFAEEAVQRGLAFDRMGQSLANMGVAAADVRGSGSFDLLVTHEKNEFNTLWKQGPRGFFQDVSHQAGLTASLWRGTGFGVVLADFDHDGFPDLAIANGKVQHGRTVKDKHIDAATFWNDYAERNQVFLNNGAGTFVDVSLANAEFCGTPSVSRGLVWGDFDGDGAVDLLVTTVAGPARMYRNIAPKKGRWLLVRALEPSLGGRDAYGAEIVVEAGKRRWWNCINPAGSYLCSNDPRAHFGLGTTERVDAIQVTWPDGSRESFAVGEIDRTVVVRKGEGQRQTPAGGARP